MVPRYTFRTSVRTKRSTSAETQHLRTTDPSRQQLSTHRLAWFGCWIRSLGPHWLASNQSSVSAGWPICRIRCRSNCPIGSGGNAFWPLFSWGGLTGLGWRSRGKQLETRGAWGSFWVPGEPALIPKAETQAEAQTTKGISNCLLCCCHLQEKMTENHFHKPTRTNNTHKP